MDFLAYGSILLIVFIAYNKKSLQKSGIFPALAIGWGLYFTGGWSFLIALYAFFISSSIASSFHKQAKESLAKKVKGKTSNRDCFQVLASGIVSLFFSLCYFFTNEDVFYVLVFVSLAVSNADTWASELGILSKKDPYTLIPFRKCYKGVSGGVSFLGLVASFFGAFLIALLCYGTMHSVFLFFLVLCFGFLGALLDSLLGSTCQVLYYDKKTKRYSEVKQVGYQYQRGLSFMNNEMVNFVSNVLTCFLFFLLWMIVLK